MDLRDHSPPGTLQNQPIQLFLVQPPEPEYLWGREYPLRCAPQSGKTSLHIDNLARGYLSHLLQWGWQSKNGRMGWVPTGWGREVVSSQCWVLILESDIQNVKGQV